MLETRHKDQGPRLISVKDQGAPIIEALLNGSD
jgi:hypothetical protein